MAPSARSATEAAPTVRRVVAVRRRSVADAANRGLGPAPPFEAPFRMRIDGDTLVLRDRHGEASVSLRDLESVEVHEVSDGKTAVAIAAPLVGILLTGLLVVSYCEIQSQGCGYPPP